MDEQRDAMLVFLSTPSARRATRAAPRLRGGYGFLSTPSARRATRGGQGRRRIQRISIHALREEGDPRPSPSSKRASKISIHALREEGDARPLGHRPGRRNFYPRPPRGGRPLCPAKSPRTPSNFYPRPPRGGRLLKQDVRELLDDISIHALREEGDAAATTKRTEASDFYPRPPRGGRRRQRQSSARARKFLSTPSARRATYGDDEAQSITEFLSTPSARRATQTVL